MNTSPDPTDRYLKAIKREVAEQTFYAHRAVIEDFAGYCDAINETSDTITIATVAEYLINKSNSCTDTTLRGKFDPLANFLAFHWHDDPSVIKSRVGAQLAPCDSKEYSGPVPYPSFDNHEQDRIALFIERLRNRHYGTRLHAIVELILATQSHLCVVRSLNCDDFKDQSGSVILGIPDTHLVGKCGLVTNRRADLPSSVVDAVEMYRRFERRSPDTGNEIPLFTTTHGRVSASALRRSLQNRTESLLGKSLSGPLSDQRDENSNGVPQSRMSFRHLWQYSLTTLDE